jgi:hypothetical protein
MQPFSILNLEVLEKMLNEAMLVWENLNVVQHHVSFENMDPNFHMKFI